MFAKRLGVTLAALSGVLAVGWSEVGCTAASPPTTFSGDGQSAALADSGYSSIINDPSTGKREWLSGNPTESGLAYWHVGWVSSKGSAGTAVEYVLATGYDRVSQQQVIEVVIPQTANSVAYEFRPLPGAPQLDDNKLAPDLATISAGLASVLSPASSGHPAPQTSQCVGGTSSYQTPSDLRTLRRCQISGSAYDPTTGTTTGAPQPGANPIVVFLNIALGIAEDIQQEAHCDPSVQPLGSDYQQHPADSAGWANDCSNGSVPSDADGAAGAAPDGGARTAGSSCPVVGAVCFSSDGSKRGVCGADYRCWQ